MYRKLLASTALSLVMAGGAFAQDALDDPMLDDPAMDPGMEATEEAPAQPLVDPAELGINGDGWLATELIGMDIENSTAEDAETIGEVNDIVLNSRGEIAAVIVGVGGFLGIGQKDVAIAFDELELIVDAEGNQQLVANRTREQLENALDFDGSVWLASEQDNGGWFDMDLGDDDPDAMQPVDDTAVDAEDPALDADEPALDAEDPAMEAEDPALDPDEPAMEAEDPALDVDEPATETEDPALDVDEPAMEAEDPALDPDEPALDPGEPADPAAEGDDAAMDPATDEGAALGWDTFETVTTAEISAEELTGTTVYGAGDENVGSIGDVILSDDAEVEAVIIDFGGFLGIGTKPVAVAFSELTFYRDEGGNLVLRTSLTEQELEAAPEYNEDAYLAAPGDPETTITLQQ